MAELLGSRVETQFKKWKGNRMSRKGRLFQTGWQSRAGESWLVLSLNTRMDDVLMEGKPLSDWDYAVSPPQVGL